MSEPEILLRAVDLQVSYRQQEGWLPVLHRVNFAIRRGETFGLVGESGCGKSTVALQLLGYRHPSARVEGGHIEFGGRDLLTLPRRELDRIRGDRISFVPQNPTTALNPGMRVGDQVVEILRLHKRVADAAQALARVTELFGLVGLPTPRALLGRYPHQLSGGQQQRVCIAMALACDPDLVVLDEPTTGLDVTTQEQIVELLIDLRQRIGLSMLYVTHDLGLLSQIADRVGVMYAGHMVEIAPVAELFHQPRHPYTRGLIGSIPRIDRPDEPAARPLRGLLRRNELPAGCPFQPRCDFAEASCAVNHQTLDRVAPGHEVACQRWRALLAPAVAAAGEAAAPRATVEPEPPLLALDHLSIAYGATGGALSRFLGAAPFVAVRDVNLAIGQGETLALVGESGSGKSTVARAVSGLLRPHDGQVLLRGQKLAGLVRERSGDQRREIQYIFQNPDASLNPRAKIGTILARPLEMFFDLDRRATRERVLEALADVRLDAGYADRYADQLSGGERQRVAIARALIARPTLLLCDEVLSALDVSVQANVLDLLRRLRSEHQVAMLFISHDLAVVRSIADKVGVLFQGQLMQLGRTEDIFAPPFHPYTHSLLMAVPDPDRPRRSMPAARRVAARPAMATGCPYAGRCAWQPGPVCETATPPWRKTGRGAAIYCHLPLDELAARARWTPSEATAPSSGASPSPFPRSLA
ncbi:MAG TPA: ABC transporter ATP-binding protein [Hypericibacter adhaerens]|uniref:ABC transporter ATP-binding protein n=1 Tax=Hypericibacter adhaerens TaxID=2602016 RepID=UPI002BEE8100|nr:ABC transporter ATP-binding protein [Hypericibacter adhaerens]HWA43587.1 ABC transporter ATP-binding protein [Hypericibacter adhaerens]